MKPWWSILGSLWVAALGIVVLAVVVANAPMPDFIRFTLWLSIPFTVLGITGKIRQAKARANRRAADAPSS